MNIKRVYVICASCGRNNPAEAIECPRCHWTPPGQKSLDERLWDMASPELKDSMRAHHELNRAFSEATGKALARNIERRMDDIKRRILDER